MCPFHKMEWPGGASANTTVILAGSATVETQLSARLRVALIHISQETNDFNPIPTTLGDFEALGIMQGRTMLEALRGVELDRRVLQASCYPMRPWLDVAEAEWSCVIVTDGDRALAETMADDLATLAWSMRDAFQVRAAVPVDEAVLMADREPQGVVLLSDTGDTVFGGAAGDSTLLLEAMLRLGVAGPALVPLISPGAVERLAASSRGSSPRWRSPGSCGASRTAGWTWPTTVTG